MCFISLSAQKLCMQGVFSELSTIDNMLKIAECGSSKKFYSPQLCALQLLAFDSNIFQCAVYGGLWLLMCVESCDKRVAGVITSMLLTPLK